MFILTKILKKESWSSYIDFRWSRVLEGGKLSEIEILHDDIGSILKGDTTNWNVYASNNRVSNN